MILAASCALDALCTSPVVLYTCFGGWIYKKCSMGHDVEVRNKFVRKFKNGSLNRFWYPSAERTRNATIFGKIMTWSTVF